MQLKKQIVLSYGITAIPNTSTLIIPMLDKPRINLRIHLHTIQTLLFGGSSGLSEEDLFKAMACKSDTH